MLCLRVGESLCGWDGPDHYDKFLIIICPFVPPEFKKIIVKKCQDLLVKTRERPSCAASNLLNFQ